MENLLTLSLTWNLSIGVVVPIPTLPATLFIPLASVFHNPIPAVEKEVELKEPLLSAVTNTLPLFAKASILIFPFTSNFSCGEVVPIPTFPVPLLLAAGLTNTVGLVLPNPIIKELGILFTK